MGSLTVDRAFRLGPRRFGANQQRHHRESFHNTSLMNTPARQKATLRSHFKSQREQLPGPERERHSAQICSHLATNTWVTQADTVAVYLGIGAEACIDGWFSEAWQNKQALFAPAIEPLAKRMHLHPLTPTTPLQTGPHGIRSPTADIHPPAVKRFHCMLLPLVAYDLSGTRLGMGGGYYDRYIDALAHRPRLIGIAFQVQQSEDALPREPWDIPLDGVITEQGFYRFAGR